MSARSRYIYSVWALLIVGLLSAIGGSIALYFGAGHWAGALTAAGLMAVIAALSFH